MSPLFPPVADAEAICAGKFVLGLLDFGIDVSVITCANARTPVRLDESALWRQLGEVSFDVPAETAGFLRRCWLGVRYRTRCWSQWTHASVEAACALHARRPFDLVVSRSLPQQAHLAGAAIASRLGLPWIAHVNDPWEFDSILVDGAGPKVPPAGFDWRASFRRVAATADVLSFPCARLRDHCLRLAGSSRTAGVAIVPHIGRRGTAVPSAGEFRIVHAGKLGINDPTGRSAASLLDGLAELARRRPASRSSATLTFVGPEDPDTRRHAERAGLANVAFTGQVTYADSLEQVAAASACVLVEGKLREGVFLPSKLCDYLVAGKPVLALSPEIGTAGDLAREGGIFQVASNDRTAVADALTRLFDAHQRAALDVYRPRPALVQRFTSDNVIDQFLNSIAAHLPARGTTGRRREAS